MVLEGDVDEVDEEVPNGSVKSALSRKRGVTKKRKKFETRIYIIFVFSFSFVHFLRFVVVVFSPLREEEVT
jgi:hypothetical protein